MYSIWTVIISANSEALASEIDLADWSERSEEQMMYVAQVTIRTTVFVEAENESEAKLMASIKASVEAPDGVNAKVIDSYEE